MVVREVAAAGEHGPLAGVPQRDVRRLDLVGRRRGGEREVQAGAVGVAVREVAAGDAGVGDGEQGAAHGVEQAGAAATTGAAISIVSTTNPLRVSACSAEVSLRWSSQAATSSSLAGSAPAQAVGDDGHRGVDDRRLALVEHEQRAARAVAAVAAGRLDGVVEPQHGRRRPAAQDRPAGLDAVGERGERPRRAPLGGRQRVGAQPHPGDHAERALRAEEQLGQVGADGAGRRAAGAHDPCRRRARPRGRRRGPRSCRSASSTARRRGRRPSRRRWRCRSSAGSGGRSARGAPAARPRGRGRTSRRAPRRCPTWRRRRRCRRAR